MVGPTPAPLPASQLPQGFFAFQAQGSGAAPGRARGWVAERAVYAPSVGGHEGAGASECARRRECVYGESVRGVACAVCCVR